LLLLFPPPLFLLANDLHKTCSVNVHVHSSGLEGSNLDIIFLCVWL
jgi:hypothetical protein